MLELLYKEVKAVPKDTNGDSSSSDPVCYACTHDEFHVSGPRDRVAEDTINLSIRAFAECRANLKTAKKPLERIADESSLRRDSIQHIGVMQEDLKRRLAEIKRRVHQAAVGDFCTHITGPLKLHVESSKCNITLQLKPMQRSHEAPQECRASILEECRRLMETSAKVKALLTDHTMQEFLKSPERPISDGSADSPTHPGGALQALDWAYCRLKMKTAIFR